MTISGDIYQAATDTAFAAASALMPLSVAVNGQVATCVQIDAWDDAAEFMDGMQAKQQTGRVAVRALDLKRKPSPGDRFKIGLREGEITAVGDGTTYYDLSLLAYK